MKNTNVDFFLFALLSVWLPREAPNRETDGLFQYLTPFRVPRPANEQSCIS